MNESETTPAEEIMSRIDATWLRVETPNSPFLIHGTFRTAGPADIEEMIALLRERIPRLHRMRQRAVDGTPRAGGWWPGVARWVNDPNFSFDRHLHRHPTLNEHDFPAELRRIQPRPIDFRHPPWEVHLFPLTDGGVRFLFRIHHCIGDGFAMGRLLRYICDDAPDALPAAVPIPTPWQSLLQWILAFTRRPLALVRLALLRKADATLYRSAPGHIRPMAWTPALPLEPVQRMRARSGATINEILTAVICEAMRRDALSRNWNLNKALIRAAVPFNLRRRTELQELGNRFGLLFINLPLDSMDFDSRLELVRQRMRSRKKAQQAQAFLETLRYFSTGGPRLHRWIVHLLTSKASLVLTHVRAPDKAVSIGGKIISHIAFCAPQAGLISMSASVLTYADTVTIGFQAIPAAHPNPQALAKRCAEVFREVLGSS